MASVYARGGRLWCRLKDEAGKWISKSTPFNVGDERKAERYASAAQAEIDRRRDAGEAGPLTVKRYADKWIAERRTLGIRTVGDDEARLRLHVLPVIGSMRLPDVKPRTIRDLIRALRKADELAPRTIRAVYGTLHTMFHDATAEEHIAATPCVLGRRDLPGKVDADPEWRAAATFTTAEVERLIGDTAIPVERRVQYALKAIAGLRHGEVAGLRWRHYDATIEPLGRLVIATSYNTGRTKTEVTRRVPVHPTLAAVLAAWRLSHWPRVYGRQPGPDDLVVPTRNMTPVSANDAGRAMKDDLRALGLRVEAGERRTRGGHDLRAWFITTCQEHGAHRDLLRVVTHTSSGDVVSGYTRATWPALCSEVAKLKCAIRGGEVLALATDHATTERKARNRWLKVVTPTGIEPVFSA